ncbi:MAG: O-acetyl-ADP-ribose deacetylase [Bacteroidales bacterium]|nr:O-acetyl-ADP-ribose deacetylase [Bacteroidales bacterium]
MDQRIELFHGDITQMKVDAIVNAANNTLMGGGGVDGAIHQAAGPGLLAECMKLSGCATGKAQITKAYKLPSKHIIHTVGPIWSGGLDHEEKQLSSAYNNSLKLALKNNCKTIAFPNISTGVYHFPKSLAAEIAIREVSQFLIENPEIERVYFVCFDQENYKIYSKLLAEE